MPWGSMLGPGFQHAFTFMLMGGRIRSVANPTAKKTPLAFGQSRFFRQNLIHLHKGAYPLLDGEFHHLGTGFSLNALHLLEQGVGNQVLHQFRGLSR